MASTDGRTNPSLKEFLFKHAYEFEFFQAVRLLTRMYPDLDPVGGPKPSKEAVRFAVHQTLAFPAGAIYEILERPSGPHGLVVTFFGLTGTQGVLPYHYTEHLIARRAAKDHAMAAFLDMFNHRLLSLFYRAWERHRPFVSFERVASRNERDKKSRAGQEHKNRAGEPGGADEELNAFTQNLFDLIGMGTKGLRGRLPIPDQALLLYAGLIAQRPRSASALRGILRDYFQVPVEIDQCIGDWYPLKAQDRSHMLHEGVHNKLGVGAISGDEVWDQQARFRLRVGPLGLNRFLAFLPDGGDTLPKLVALTRFFVGRTFAFEVNLILKAGEVPVCRLDDEGADAPRLGWLGWLKTDSFDIDASDVEFTYVS